jgi:hypothetical protein
LAGYFALCVKVDEATLHKGSFVQLDGTADNDRDTPADRIDTSRTIPWFRIATDMQPLFLR